MQRKKKFNFFSVFPLVIVLILLCVPQPALAAETQKLIPAGKTVGVTMDTKGLLVLATGAVNGEGNEVQEPSKGILEEGDLILKANGKEMENKEAFQQAVQNSNGEKMKLLLERNGKRKNVEITPVFNAAEQTYQIGAWIRDSIQGIGTVTYYDPTDGDFGALGHGVYDVDTGELMALREGRLVASEVTEIVKGKKGAAGELTGKVILEEKLGEIEKNTPVGIYGKAKETAFEGQPLPVAATEEIRKGKAWLFSDLEGGEVKAYGLEIENIRKNERRNGKDMTIRITDERLLRMTGGIVQGMSGSPIVQDGRIVGAVTHVMVNDPTKGYGIFIENMLEG